MTILTDDTWWRRAVIYQIYPKSFADANGDGVGDIAGVGQRLDYLVDLGVDAVWFSPFFPSPQRDGGYDVSDYRDIDPIHGSLVDAEGLIADAHMRGIKVIIDVVPNHSSGQHRFFREALATTPGSPAWDRYHCVRGKGEIGELPPNNWQSIFGGNAWTQIRDQSGFLTEYWYLHLFDTGQPDFNWNHPDVIQEFDDTLRFWFDRGVDGFRIDVAQGLVKQVGYPDVQDLGDPLPLDVHARPYFDQPEVHDIYRRWRSIADEYSPRRIFVAEAWLDTAEKRSRYLRTDELHTGFNFDILVCDWSAAKWRNVVDSALAADALVGAPTTWVTENHDVRRAPTRYAGNFVDREMPTAAQIETGRCRSMAMMLAILALPGTAYIYNGQELGLEEVIDLDDSQRQDPYFRRTRGKHLGRDGCRVPMPWSRRGVSLGFGPDEGAAPWLSQPAHWAKLSVEAQSTDPFSMLNITRRALHLRRSSLDLLLGDFAWLPDVAVNDGIIGFARQQSNSATRTICIMNMGITSAPLPDGEVIVSSALLESRNLQLLPPDTAVWIVRG
jgi:alpha-glucosidase